jgi:hypothetical protein
MKGRLQILHAKTPGSSGQRQEQRMPGQRHTSRQERQERQVSTSSIGFQGCCAAFVVAPGRSARASSPARPDVDSALRALESSRTSGKVTERQTPVQRFLFGALEATAITARVFDRSSMRNAPLTLHVAEVLDHGLPNPQGRGGPGRHGRACSGRGSRDGPMAAERPAVLFWS